MSTGWGAQLVPAGQGARSLWWGRRSGRCWRKLSRPPRPPWRPAFCPRVSKHCCSNPGWLGGAWGGQGPQSDPEGRGRGQKVMGKSRCFAVRSQIGIPALPLCHWGVLGRSSLASLCEREWGTACAPSAYSQHLPDFGKRSLLFKVPPLLTLPPFFQRVRRKSVLILFGWLSFFLLFSSIRVI